MHSKSKPQENADTYIVHIGTHKTFNNKVDLAALIGWLAESTDGWLAIQYTAVFDLLALFDIFFRFSSSSSLS